jgi:hypothetical protein
VGEYIPGIGNRVQIGRSTLSPNAIVVTFSGITAGWRQVLMFSSDRHHDNAHCDHALEREHLRWLAEQDGLVLDFGDCLDAMQGFGDPRADLSALRTENKVTAYADSLVASAADFYRPWANRFLVMGQGNHESAFLKRHGTHLPDRPASALRRDQDGNELGHCLQGGYGGWVRFNFQMRGRTSRSIRLKYHHGAGGGGPVTRGMIDTNRQSVFLPDADIVVNGHIHDTYITQIARERLSDLNRIHQDFVYSIRTSTYKDEYGDGSGGFHVERGRPPKPIGCVVCELIYNSTNDAIEIKMSHKTRVDVESYAYRGPDDAPAVPEPTPAKRKRKTVWRKKK